VPGAKGWVLVTDGGSGGSRDALAAVRALAAAGYSPAVTVSGSPGPTPSRFARRRLRMPGVDDPRFVDELRSARVRGGYLAIVPASEDALTALGVSVPELLDKVGLERAARRVGLEVPPGRTFADTRELLHAAAELDYPVVVKPRTRRYLAFRAGSPRDLRAAPADGGPVLVQPYLAHGLRAVSGVMHEGKLAAAVHERWLRIWPYPCGLASAAITTEPDVELEQRLAALLQGHEGIFCAQLAGPYLLDVNLRIHSSHPLAVAAGVNLIAIACDLERGEAVAPVRARPGSTYRWIEGDVRHVVGALRSGRMSPLEALGALRPRRATAHSTESLLDPGPLLARLWYGVRRANLSEQERARPRAAGRAGA
jgi:predicted ATP-grasp superfamily ATP-dependent carboligase